MHSRELAKLGALVALHGPTFLRQPDWIAETHSERYWCYSRARLDRWGHALRAYRSDAPADQQTGWSQIRDVIVEVLLSDILTRVWTAVALSFDRQHATHRLDPFVSGIYDSHQEMRNRALYVMVQGHDFDLREAITINHMRRRTERWTDMLLSYVSPAADVREFAFEASRVEEYSVDQEGHAQLASELASQLLLASLTMALHQGLDTEPATPALNQQICASVLGCFHSERFDATGMLQSVWIDRLYQTSADAHGMITELIALERPYYNRLVQ